MSTITIETSKISYKNLDSFFERLLWTKDIKNHAEKEIELFRVKVLQILIIIVICSYAIFILIIYFICCKIFQGILETDNGTVMVQAVYDTYEIVDIVRPEGENGNRLIFIGKYVN